MSPDASACATLIGNAGTYPSTVASHPSYPSCVGSVPGLFDMSGNIWEWEDQCSSSPMNGGKDLCTVRGGSVANTADQATCFVTQRYAVDFRYYKHRHPLLRGPVSEDRRPRRGATELKCSALNDNAIVNT